MFHTLSYDFFTISALYSALYLWRTLTEQRVGQQEHADAQIGEQRRPDSLRRLLALL